MEAADLIKYKVFDRFRVEFKEVEAPKKISVQIDGKGVFDYETGHFTSLTID